MSDNSSLLRSNAEGTSRSKIVLTLSGGGMRALIFHLGVLRQLAASRLLESVVGLSTVSGGSLAVAALFSNSGMQWPSSDEYDLTVFPALRKLITRGDLFSLRAIGWRGVLKYNRKIFVDRARILAEQLSIRWGITQDLRDLPDAPSWHVNATCFETGKNWRFSKRVMGDW